MPCISKTMFYWIRASALFSNYYLRQFLSFFLSVLGLLCCTQAFSSCGEQGLLSCNAQFPHCSVLLQSTGSGHLASVVAVCRLRYSTAQHVESSGPETTPVSPVLAGRFLSTMPPGKFNKFLRYLYKYFLSYTSKLLLHHSGYSHLWEDENH